jgi:tetratricopeptide (TPR) repeat protein
MAKPPAKKSVNRFAAPGRDWALAIDLKGYQIEQDRVDQAGKQRYVMATNKRNGLSISFWIEPMEEDWDSKACRKHAWAKEVKSPFKKEDIKMWELGDLAIVEYVVPEFNGLAVRQKNYRAYLTHDHAWMDIHVSKIDVSTEDEARIRKLLKSVHIVKGKGDNPPPDKQTDIPPDLLVASRLYLLKEHRQASVYYQKVLDAEKKSRTLKQDAWRVLVDNLGMCYGMTGKLEQAKEIFEYGIGEDPQYPMFHYNLACTYSEMGDLNAALSCLEKAIKYRANMIKGEKLPDPRKDESFRKYAKDPGFLKVAKKFEK